MAHWGIAYAIGPNYNKPWETFEAEEKPDALAQARDAVACASRLVDQVTPAERALIEAIPKRYPEDAGVEDFGPWNDAYADAMRAVHKDHSDDIDICLPFRGSDHEPHALAAVGPAFGQAGRGRRHAGSDRSPGDRLRPARRGLGASRPAAHVHPPDGNVAASRARAAPRRSPEHPGARCGPSAAHGHPHRRALRRLRERRLQEPHGDPGGPEVPAAGRRRELLFRLSLPQLPLQDLRGDVPRPAGAGPGGGRRADRDPAPRTCCGPWRTGSKPSFR